MGRRKPFVDKKNSTTYNVIYREAAQDDEGAAERDWIEANKGVGVGRPDMDLLEERHHQESLQGRRYPAGHPLSWLDDEESQAALSEECRKQILDLGFPDDGYDYLKHMRVLGRGKGQGLSSAAGPHGAASTEAAAPGTPDLNIRTIYTLLLDGLATSKGMPGGGGGITHKWNDSTLDLISGLWSPR